MTIQPEQEVSIARRRMLIAAGAGALVPVLVPAPGFAASASAANPVTASPLPGKPGERFVLSGRIEGAQAAPLCGQTVEVLGDRAVLTTTDSDGRFVLVINAPAHLDHIFLKVSGKPTNRIELTHNTARLARDSDGVWRAAVAIAMT